MTASEAYASEANELGAKLWKRAKQPENAINHGIYGRVLSAKQIANLTSSEQALVRSGWMSCAYGQYGCDTKPNQFGEYWIVKK